ncbi:hypothetical protein [Azohydromonas lata]|uniref:Uncharacterized protein n=1 Tax=Azohydromonas lata TaxID=45677 RepID=A0ABU5I7G6_9BURK|nr:hypothetical protein [Azohydromonas lata]MDZ5455024.1 hypothetical protein [Azohydromonas lata]
MEQNEPQEQARPWVTKAEAERRVAEAKEQVAALVAWIAELRRLGYDTTEPTAVLIALTDELLRCYEELGIQAGGGWRPRRRPPDGP